MTAGDARAWEAVQRWRTTAAAGPGWWGRLGSWAVTGLRWLPGAGLLDDLVEGVVDDVVVGAVLEPLHELGLRLGWATAGGAEHVLAALAAAGFEVTGPDDLRRLDVDDLRAARGSLERVHIAAAGMRGGLSGAAAGAAAGASSAAVGLAAGLAAIALDTVLAAATCTRAVARVAQHYGYDPAEPSEREFALAVLAAGLSPHPHEAVVGPVPAHLGLARSVPALGVGLGVVLSVRQVGRVLETAEHLYTERFLREKYSDDEVAVAA